MRQQYFVGAIPGSLRKRQSLGAYQTPDAAAGVAGGSARGPGPFIVDGVVLIPGL